MSTWELWYGGAVWTVPDGGGFSGPAVVPINLGEGVCDAVNEIDRWYLNPTCKGCDSGGNRWDHILDQIILTKSVLAPDSAEVDGNLCKKRPARPLLSLDILLQRGRNLTYPRYRSLSRPR
jgi:hypothetical protein